MIENTNITPAVNQIIYNVLKECYEEIKEITDGGATCITFEGGLKQYQITLDEFQPQVNYAEVFNACEAAFWHEYHEDKDMEFYESADMMRSAAWDMGLRYRKAVRKL